MKWHYKTVTFLPVRCNNESLAAKCLRVLHGFNYEYETRSIGVSFPLWCDDTVGSKISFVSTNRIELDLLLKQHYFTQMKELHYFDISKTKVVPDGCEYVSFKRCQSIDKTTTAGQSRKLKRLEKRAIARGEQLDLTSIRLIETIVLPHYHSLEESSQSHKSRFRLNIRMHPESNSEGSSIFSSYGLANSEDSFQPVPLI
ncbi:type I-F CRISPR-associated endoribonuclease Cas6/Csy4 [Agarivorans sp. B2Z047]|uniref:type I-F CRISPR-associated endoribonuclease Cas6/Csy4 n=1 Tax=Agarivorans sp. B2Z047 TaxID=2652721 RepID=UPI00128E36D8|nr:type I-F CRISPR-associated endoribonuclease Cas6/Csy4 [Agarivorans sp. B2Z047]MPW29677.1 type I-F CRISPR-associated endoribonuclease Cas6/Csy4 [Agarivorans sp. B2Z047]UQN40631.1 type I-F CRISPR-associated endoribonuclease Cas6/Csy4 [Agarivorans sp. B2Z047]